jgi:hypothetical protein
LFDKSTDLNIRESIVHALAETNSSDQLGFFASLLPGHSSEPRTGYGSGPFWRLAASAVTVA